MQQTASAQPWRCTSGTAADYEESARARQPPCAGEPERIPPARSAVVAPPVVKRVLPPDPNKEERALREQLHRALRKHDRGTASQMTPDCRKIVRQLAAEQPLLRSLRADTRSHARERTAALTSSFRERGC